MLKLQEPNIFILGPKADLDYFDHQTKVLPSNISVLEAWNIIMSRNQPVLKVAFRIRDAISSLFGVKKIGGFSGSKRKTVAEGEYLDFFLVERAEENLLLLTERDKHLDVLTCVSADGNTISVTSSVKVHNLFGRLYMLPVGFAHRWIVQGMLTRLQRELAGSVIR